jgi:hypothetical protein
MGRNYNFPTRKSDIRSTKNAVGELPDSLKKLRRLTQARSLWGMRKLVKRLELPRKLQLCVSWYNLCPPGVYTGIFVFVSSMLFAVRAFGYPLAFPLFPTSLT